MPTLWENENHDKWKAIFQSDFDSCRLWFKDEVGLGEGTLIFCAVYLAPRVKEYISNEGALSRPTESFPWELWSANEALDTWSSCFSWFWLRALINSVGLFFFFFLLWSTLQCTAPLCLMLQSTGSLLGQRLPILSHRWSDQRLREAVSFLRSQSRMQGVSICDWMFSGLKWDKCS